MVPWAMKETFGRVATQPGSTAKKWDREELIRCRATGTGISTETNLRGRVHPVFADWVVPDPELRRELEQPILLASKMIRAVGLPWLADFLIDDIFDESYPGRAHGIGGQDHTRPASAYGEGIIPHCIVRHQRAPRTSPERRAGWRRAARDVLRYEVPKSIQWQMDGDMFRRRGWSGYTCRHPRGGLPLGEIDDYETIRMFDGMSPHDKHSRSLTILLMAEYPTRLAELRRQGRAQGEEYLLTAFMTTVTLLHELGHAIYWKDRRSLTRDLREPFYGGDMEMELGNSFVASVFGGWIPVSVRELSQLRGKFSLADGIAWRQALNWDHHRTRPKYRTHYSISVDYIARLFTQESWSTTRDGRKALIRPQSLTGNSIALQTVGLYTFPTETNQHATAAIADFHCEGYGWVWNRRPGAWFRVPQFDGCLYPELELPTAGEDAIREPVARGPRGAVPKRDPTLRSSLSGVRRDTAKRQMTGIGARLVIDVEAKTGRARDRVRKKEATWSLLPPLPKSTAIVTITTTKPDPRTSEYSPHKLALSSPRTKIPQPVPGESTVSRCDVGISKPRKRDRIRASRLVRGGAGGGQSPREREPPSPLSTPKPSPTPLLTLSPIQAQEQQGRQQQWLNKGVSPYVAGARPVQRICYDKEEEEQQEQQLKSGNEDAPCARLGGYRDGDNVGDYDRGEISVDELKKRLSQLIGVSLTELEGLFERQATARVCGY